MNREDQPTQVPARDRPEGEDLWQRYGAERGVWTEAMLIALHDRRVKGSKWFSLIDKVSHQRTLEIAWSKVEANAGACGVDGVNIAHFSKYSARRLLAVNKHLREGSYQPSAIKRVHIPKAGSKEKRPLGIPVVRDRIVQGALKLVLEPIFEREFCDNSYGFRPGRGCKDALREVDKHLANGHLHIVDVDIKGYFDAIPHEALMHLVKERVSDGQVLGLIEAFLKAPVREGEEEIQPTKGTPQGGLISPLLANLYLNPLDWMLESHGLKSVRYADDIVIVAKDSAEAQRALTLLRDWMEQAELELHPEKTRVVDLGETNAYFDFLGYRFLRSSRGRLIKKARPKSLVKLREQIRKHTKRCHSASMIEIISKVNEVLRGWYEYFKHAKLWTFEALDSWVRMRLRSILRKRHKGKGRGRGLDHIRWPNRYFAKLGLLSLKQAKEEEMSLRKRATC